MIGSAPKFTESEFFTSNPSWRLGKKASEEDKRELESFMNDEGHAKLWKALHPDMTNPFYQWNGDVVDKGRGDGGPGSGNFGHEGRPGEIGGSSPSDSNSGAADIKAPYHGLSDEGKSIVEAHKNNPNHFGESDEDKENNRQKLIKALNDKGVKVEYIEEEGFEGLGYGQYRAIDPKMSLEENATINSALSQRYYGSSLSKEEYIKACREAGTSPRLHEEATQAEGWDLKTDKGKDLSDGTPVFWGLKKESVLSDKDLNKYAGFDEELSPDTYKKTEEAAEKAIESMSNDEKIALNNYTKQYGPGTYAEVNKLLATGEGSEATKRAAGLIETATDHPIGANCLTSRGARAIHGTSNDEAVMKIVAQVSKGNFTKAGKLKEMLEGKEFTNQAAMSTSPGGSTSKYGELPVQMIFKTPSNAKAVNISKLSAYNGGRSEIEKKLAATGFFGAVEYESEVLYHPGSRYRVDKVHYSLTRDGKKRRGQVFLECTILTDNEDGRFDGGPGSGNFGHKGVPGQIGGSAPSGSDSPAKTAKKSKKDFLPAKSYMDTPDFQKAAKAAKEAREKSDKAWSRIKEIDEEMKKESKPKPQKDWDDNDMLDDLLGRRPKILTERGKQLKEERAEAWKEVTEADHQFTKESDKLRDMKREAHRREIKNFHPEPLKPAKSDDYDGFTLDETSNSYGDEYLHNGKGVIREMTPKEYLERCAFEIFDDATMESCIGSIDEEVAQGYAKQMREGVRFHLPYLNYRQSGQEGRHRAYAAYLAGIEKIPVLIIGRPNRNDGGPGSGNFGHEGRPGKIGGSAPEDGAKRRSEASGSSTGQKQEFMSKRKANEFISKLSDSNDSEQKKEEKIDEFLKSLPIGSKVQTPAHWNDDGKPDTLIWDGHSFATRKNWESGGWSCSSEEMAYYFASEDKNERPTVTSIASTPEEKQKWAEQYDKSNWRGNDRVWQKGGSFGETMKIRMRKLDVDGCGVGTVVTGSDGRKYIKDYDGYEKSPDGLHDVTKYAWRDVETYDRADMRVLKSPTFEGDFFAVNFGLNGVSDTECARARATYDHVPEEMRPTYEKIFRDGNFEPSMPTYDDPEPGSYYSPRDGKVHFGKNATAETIFHEVSHAFDRGALRVDVDLPGAGRYTITSASEYLDHFADTSDGVKKDFEAMASVFGFKTNGEGWFSEEYGDAEEIDTAFELMRVYDKGCKQFEGIEGFDSVSDAVSALTQDRCLASFWHGGHSTSYWRQPYGGDRSSARAKEYWANYCQLRASKCDDALALLKKITPTMYSAAEDAYKEVFGNGEK